MEYWTINEETFDDIVAKVVNSGLGYEAKSFARYLRTELEQATIRNCALVIYMKDNEWRHLFIHRRYNVDFVMTHAKDRL